MHARRLATALAAVFAGTSVLFLVFGLVYNLFFLVVSALFAAVTYFVWYHASGRLAARLYRGVEQQAEAGGGTERGGFGAGPREEWRPPRDGASAAAAGGARGGTAGQRGQRGQRQAGRGPRTTARQRRRRRAEAYRTLGLEPGADEEEVRAAYRERVKEVHPDAADGDEDEFKAVTEAYELLTDD